MKVNRLLEFVTTVVILCAPLVFGDDLNGSVERKNERYGFYDLANCTAKCLRQTKMQSFRDCFRLCNHATKLSSDAFELELYSAKYLEGELKLVCREDTTVYLKFDTNDTAKPFLKYAYFVLVQKVGGPKSLTGYGHVVVSQSPIVAVPNLEPNTDYYIALAYILDSNHEFISVSNLKEVRTLPVGYTPLEVSKVRFGEFKQNRLNRTLVDTEVLWAPAEDRVCSYDLTISTESTSPMRMISVQKPEKLYKIFLDSLMLDQTYSFGVTAKNPKSRKTSAGRYILFKTPKCEEIHTANLQLCREYH